MYGPIDHPPFIVFHYPPAYHLASRAVMALGVDPLAAGRMVSLAATAVISISIAWLVAAGLAGRVGPSAVLVGALHPTLGRAALHGRLLYWRDIYRSFLIQRDNNAYSLDGSRLHRLRSHSVGLGG